jgi:hypothetical protein
VLQRATACKGVSWAAWTHSKLSEGAVPDWQLAQFWLYRCLSYQLAKLYQAMVYCAVSRVYAPLRINSECVPRKCRAGGVTVCFPCEMVADQNGTAFLYSWPVNDASKHLNVL